MPIVIVGTNSNHTTNHSNYMLVITNTYGMYGEVRDTCNNNNNAKYDR